LKKGKIKENRAVPPPPPPPPLSGLVEKLKGEG
jgi:hypothetical protein